MAKVPAEVALEIGLDDSEDLGSIRRRIASRLRIPVEELPAVELCRRTLDARGGRVRFHLVYSLGSGSPSPPAGPLPAARRDLGIVIVGAGPAGLFCAYELARQGVRSVLIERGQPVARRGDDIRRALETGAIDPESNYCFGEGGAGTFSDGKLYTRSHKRGNLRDVLEVLVAHGAPCALLTEARPHLGSDRLPGTVAAFRADLEQAGVEVRFGSRVVDVGVERRSAGPSVSGVRLSDGKELTACAVVLATGHSAHDVYAWLGGRGAELAPKDCAMGVRIEHPQSTIDRIQYGPHAGHPRLGAASYRVAATIDGRGVFSFCMCPGGTIVPAATEPDGLVVNGMSLARRSSPFGNSGLVVAVTVEDFGRAGFPGPLGGLEFGRRLERAAARAGGGKLRAPATRVSDFLARRPSSSLPPSSYAPGLVPVDLAELLDENVAGLAGRLRAALPVFERRMHGYVSPEAVMVGVETRTSSPVRIVRDPATLEARGLRGLYPAGEGSGYAGGIMSSAVDGINVARSLLEALG